MKKKLFTIPDELAEKLEAERNGNQSKVVTEALKIYYENRETIQRLISLNKQLIDLVEESNALRMGPPVPEKTFEQHLQEKLALTRSNHPDWTLRIEGSEVQAYHRGRQVWQNIDEIEEY